MDSIRTLILLSALIATPAWANDSSFGGRGGDPMPLQNDAIEMVEEHVVLRADVDKNQWTVTTDFVFRNTTDKQVDIQMGFPFVANDDEGDIATPAGAKYPEAGEPLVWDFRTWVRGEEVKVRREKASPNPKLPELHYDIVYMRDVSFAPGETVAVKNSYRHGISMSVMQDAWVHYVLRTGSLWKGGKIGRSRLEVHVPRKLRLPPPGHVAYMRDNDGSILLDKKGEKLVLMTFETKPPGARIEHTTEGSSVYWDLRDFTPKTDLEVSFVFDEAAPNFHRVDLAKYTDDLLQKMSKEELRFIRNTISAQHGYTFKSEDLQNYFGTKWWYVPKADFDFDKALSEEEKEMVRKIKALEGKAPSKPATDPVALEHSATPDVQPSEPQAAPKDAPAEPSKPSKATEKPPSTGCATAPGTAPAGPLLFVLGFATARRRRRR